ncbi:MAG: hypothetical protein ACLRMW_18855, partial [[Clostridium] symbiosum]
AISVSFLHNWSQTAKQHSPAADTVTFSYSSFNLFLQTIPSNYSFKKAAAKNLIFAAVFIARV